MGWCSRILSEQEDDGCETERCGLERRRRRCSVTHTTDFVGVILFMLVSPVELLNLNY